MDRVAERILLGQDPDVEGLIASAPDMPPDTREQLRKMAGAFHPLPLVPAIGLARDEELPFAELGPYKLVSRIGEGGMGVVYLAEHRFLERRVALKVIRPELALSTVTRARFQREAMRIAKLRHAHIVTVYDAGEHDGVAYLAMEVVEGRGLDEVLLTMSRAGKRMDVTSAVRHARDVARALQCAHEAGIIHRDVKPSNIRITPDGRALLLDFGLSFAEETTSLSSLGQFVGTPQYASPEQIEPGSTDVDARTDVYSLGITLYECLTGHLPFASTSMIQLFRAILEHAPSKPSERNERVDRALNDIVMRAVAKRREDRFLTAQDMAAALEDWLQRAERTAPTVRRKHSVTRTSIFAAAVLALGVGAWLALRDVHVAPLAAPSSAQPVVLSSPRKTTALLGTPDLGFDQRLNRWDVAIGGGTFGADEERPGVIGTCNDGITVMPHVLPGGSGRVRGRLEPIPHKPGERTRAAGAAIEFSNGNIVALLLVAAADGYDVHVCELTRDGDAHWTRGASLERGGGARSDSGQLAFTLSWNDTDTQLDWSDAGATTDARSFVLPRTVRGAAHPSRFLLVVDTGSARFEELVLEEM